MSAVATPAQPTPIARRTRVPVSFELYPPRTDAGHASLERTIDHLASIDPGFISVTYGAGGTSGGRSLEVLRSIRTRTSVEPLAHLTCVGRSRAELRAVVEEFLDAGVRDFLALRGDPPQGETEWTPAPDGVSRACDLVELIREVEAERFGTRASTGLARLAAHRKITR